MKSKFLLSALIVIIALCPVLASCGSDAQQSGPLTFYSFNETDPLVRVLKQYNKYCAVTENDEDRVEIINFDSYEEYEAKLSTEVMAGKGPDILSLSQKLPFEKLINNKSLADINTIVAEHGSGFSFDDYNNVVMDSGVFGERRYVLPLYYGLDYLVTSTERLEHFGINLDNLTYDYLLENINNGSINGYLVDPNELSMRFYYSFIRQYIDIETGTTDFESEEFKNLAEGFKGAVIGEDWESYNNYDPTDTERKEYLFEGYEYSGRAGAFTVYARDFMHMNGNVLRLTVDGKAETDTLFFPNFSRSGEPSATVEIGLAVNANCRKTDKVMKLIEYLLSFDAQSYFCGGREGEDPYSGSGFLPVNKEVYEASYNSALEMKVDADQNFEMDEFDDEIFEAKNKALSEYYRPLVDSITACSLNDMESQSGTYLVQNVIKDIVESYLKSEITTDKFVQRLTDAVKMYLSE